jgi:hypothetical protein
VKVQPVSSPAAIQQAPSNESALKAKAVAAFQGQQSNSNHSAQINQNAVAVEDLSAITGGHKDPSVTHEDAPGATQADPPATTPPAQAEDPAIARQFAQIARQERALRAKVQQQDQALKAREAQLAAREAELQAKQPDLSKYIPREQVKAEVFDLIEKGEVTYDEITQRLMNPAQRDPRMEATLQKMQAKIQELEAKNEAANKNYVENQTQAYQAAVKQIRSDVNQLVYTDPNFETIKATGSAKDVVELITQTYDKDGILLSVEDAAQQVEDYLTEEALKLTRIEKIQKKLQQNARLATASSSQTKSPQQSSNSGQTQPGMKTLTNASTSTRKLSARERALLAFRGELK